MFDIKADFRPLIRTLNDLEKRQIPFATALALTRSAQAGQRAVAREMPSIFDKPTPFTMRSNYVKPATRTDLVAAVHLRDRASNGAATSRYLGPNIIGGPRALKKSELILRAAGILAPGKFLMPGLAAELDAYGNINKGQLTKVLSVVKALDGTSAFRRRGQGKRRNEKYFAIRPGTNRGGLKPAVYERIGRNVVPVYGFGSQPRYEPIFDLYGIVREAAEAALTDEFRKALRHALATARRR